MLSKKVKSRIFFLFIAIVLSALVIFVILRSLEENVVYFFSPTEIYNKTNISFNEKIRIGGLVKKNTVSLIENTNEVKFIITDNKYDISVNYVGILPDLFKEGSGVVAEGLLKKNVLYAEYIFAKHDENYMPDTIKKQLQESGRWKSIYK